MTQPPIYFYLPQRDFPRDLPASAKLNWSGFGLGIYTWTIQTYLWLQADSFPCELVSSFPDEGIVLFHRDALRGQTQPLLPKPKRLLINLKADRPSYPYAHLHVVQNPIEVSNNSYYLPHWPQPDLIPRQSQRGDRFETLAYFGHIQSLAPELQSSSWQQQLAQLGLCWRPIINHHLTADDVAQIDSRWNDYSDIDVVVAVRSFNPHQTYPNKPATKLINAWLAGVPAVMGAESAYRAEGQANVNYLEVASPTQLLAALKQLKTSPALRRSLVSQGASAAQPFLPEQIAKRWRQFLVEVAIPAWYRWCEQPRWWQQVLVAQNIWDYKIRRRKTRLKALIHSP